MRRHGKTFVTTVAIVTAITTALPASAAPSQPGTAAGTTTASSVPAGFAVTLITGDRVTVSAANGAYSAVIAPGAGRKHIAFVQQQGKDAAGQDTFAVLPVDAIPLVESERLDARLFDVLALKRFGYDDAQSPSTPLIVTGTPGLAAAKLAGAKATRTLASIGGTAVRSEKGEAGAFWRSLRGAGSSALAAGLSHVYLDGKSRVVDEGSNKQVGAPSAWAAGFDGTGVTTAVLDSGIDADHADLSGKVVEAIDFSGSEAGAKDEHGHGTHVAATIAGTGSASDGRHRGVAPGAKLLVGRVCDQDGNCPDSATIAGMEWAASKARVVSMSLGTRAPSDGTDLMSKALNKISEDTGALFVVAAGNEGPDAGTVGSPGAASAALTVGSVDRTDTASGFSSRGPLRDGSVKPDITAPGEGIISARAAGTSMGDVVDENYTAASGTSMATPHVSGAAAILAQAHPTWTGARLKAALTSSAFPIEEPVFTQGTGRLDLGRAVRQSVSSTTSVNVGRIAAPFDTRPVVRKSVAYHNAGAGPLTLALALNAGIGDAQLPAGALTLGADTVTVPAGGDAAVDVIVNPALLDADTFGQLAGRLVATSGDVSVQTVVAGIVEPESYDVTVDLIDRHGKPISAAAGAQYLRMFSLDLDLAPHPDVFRITESTVTVRVQKGRFGVQAIITTAETPDNTYGTESFTVLSLPTLTVDRDVKLTLDARTGKPMRPILDAANAERRNAFIEQRWRVNRGPDVVGYDGFGIGTGSTQPLYARTIGSDPGFLFLYRSAVGTPPGATPAHLYHLAIKTVGRAPDQIGRIRDRDLATVKARYRTQGHDVTGSRAEWIRWYPGQSGFVDLFVDNIPLPGRLTEHYNGGDVQYRGLLEHRVSTSPFPVPEGTTQTVPRSYRRGAVTSENWNSAVLGPNLTDLSDELHQLTRTEDRFFAWIPMFATPQTGHSNWAGLESFSWRGSTTLRKDGVVIGSSPFAGLGGFNAPTADAATYELEVDASRAFRWIDIGTRVNAKWTFSSARTADTERIPLRTVRVDAPLLDDYNAARGDGYFPIVMRVEAQAETKPAPVKSVTLEYSTDEGATWTPTRVLGHGDHYGAVVRHPKVGAEGGFVALRVKATDTAGQTVEQTHYRAYKLTE